MITGIAVALPEELGTLTAKRIDKNHCVFIGDKLLVAHAGAGAKNAIACAELLVGKGATQLISWGCCAGLAPTLKPGDLVLPDAVIDIDDNVIAVDRDWHGHAQRHLAGIVRLYTGKLTESTEIVSSSREKRQLQLLTDAIALDMESVAIAKFADKKSLPFLAVRTVVDPVTMELPRAIGYAANAAGDIVLRRLLLFLLLHPAELPGLIRLGFYFNAAKSTLKRIAADLDGIANFSNKAQ